jgi:hypothetical protein
MDFSLNVQDTVGSSRNQIERAEIRNSMYNNPGDVQKRNKDDDNTNRNQNLKGQ